jgi:hypothetical protein
LEALGASIVAGGIVFVIFMSLLGIFLTVFWIVELVDVARRQFQDDVTKVIWFVVVLCSHVIGALVYYFAGKPMGTLPGQRATY